MPDHDPWPRWLGKTRFGGDEKAAELEMAGLARIRDRLLAKAGLGEGKVVLDVGTGEGLIGFGALDKVGRTGRVIFSDISEALLQHVESRARQMGVLDRCSFVQARAEDLRTIPDESVDLVTTRSVLIYVDDKSKALREFLRVLKPGGRTALFEPIDDYRMKEDLQFWRERWWGKPEPDAAPVKDLLERLDEYFESRGEVNRAMINFNERDLARMCVEVGFAGIHTELHIDIGPMPRGGWEVFLNSSGNPFVPTCGEVIEEIFNSEERERLERHFRPLVERGGYIARMQTSFTWAFKAPIPARPW